MSASLTITSAVVVLVAASYPAPAGSEAPWSLLPTRNRAAPARARTSAFPWNRNR